MCETRAAVSHREFDAESAVALQLGVCSPLALYLDAIARSNSGIRLQELFSSVNGTTIVTMPVGVADKRAALQCNDCITHALPVLALSLLRAYNWKSLATRDLTSGAVDLLSGIYLVEVAIAEQTETCKPKYGMKDISHVTGSVRKAASLWVLAGVSRGETTEGR